jgi:ubiquinone/menaquinone biosynthesis C-methylase UbiE
MQIINSVITTDFRFGTENQPPESHLNVRISKASPHNFPITEPLFLLRQIPMNNHFDWHRITPDYARVYDDFRGCYSPETIRYLIQRTNIQTNSSRVLDLACGTGAVFREIVGQTRQLTAMDASWPMLAQAGSLYLHNIPNLRLVNAVGEKLPLASGCIDLVTIGQAIHWFNLPALLAELKRILRPGGWLAVLSRYPSPAGKLHALVHQIQYSFSAEGSQGVPEWTRMNAPENLLGLEKAGFGEYERCVFQNEMTLSVEGFLQGAVERGKNHSVPADLLSDFQKVLKDKLFEHAQNGFLHEPYFDYLFLSRKIQ